MTLVEHSTVDAAALARVHDYLRRAQPVDEHDREIARDAFVSGFHYGGRWSLRTTSALADQQFRDAVSALAELLGRGIDDDLADWQIVEAFHDERNGAMVEELLALRGDILSGGTSVEHLTECVDRCLERLTEPAQAPRRIPVEVAR